MTRVLLVRHGESIWNDADRVAGWAPVALTDTGRREATAVAEFLATKFAVDRVLTSDIRRASDTATRVADAVGAPVTERAAWRERDWGALQGLPSGTLLERFPELDLLESEGAATERPKGGESWRDLQARTHDALADLAGHDGTVAVVSHFGPILLAVGRARGESVETALTARRVGTGSVTQLRHEDGTWHVEALDCRPGGDR
jgi:Fructose-2,6-bisphosphatase